jgi:hypothetical protein
MAEPAELISMDSMNAWYRAAEVADRMLAADMLEGVDPYAAAREIGLPTPPEIRYDGVQTFLTGGTGGAAELARQGVTSFYIGLRPKTPTDVKYRQFGLDADGLNDYVTGNTPPDKYSAYIVQLAEYAPARYGATVIVDRDGVVTLEMVDGEMAKLATGKVSPQYTAHADPFTGVMRYSFDDAELRTAVWRALSCIPTTDEGLPRGRLPGYYEFSLIERRGRLVPVFFDYKTTRIYDREGPRYDKVLEAAAAAAGARVAAETVDKPETANWASWLSARRIYQLLCSVLRERRRN